MKKYLFISVFVIGCSSPGLSVTEPIKSDSDFGALNDAGTDSLITDSFLDISSESSEDSNKKDSIAFDDSITAVLPNEGVACNLGVSCTGNLNCCLSFTAASSAACKETCTSPEHSYKCDGPEDCKTDEVCCSGLVWHAMAWAENTSYCMSKSDGCQTDLSLETTTGNIALLCHTKADCPTDQPKCCSIAPYGPNGQRACVKSESEIPRFADRDGSCF